MNLYLYYNDGINSYELVDQDRYDLVEKKDWKIKNLKEQIEEKESTHLYWERQLEKSREELKKLQQALKYLEEK